MSEREIMEYDVIVVGAGPSGLACAMRLKQLKSDLNVPGHSVECASTLFLSHVILPVGCGMIVT